MSTKTLAELTKPLPLFHPKAWWLGFLKLGLKAAAPFSEGIRIGFAHGFDSGVMLDHVYRNQAQGVTPLGRAIDRMYLNSPGWVGIRNRGALLRKTIAEQIEILNVQNGAPVQMTDLACGGGDYILGSLLDTSSITVDAVLRDYENANIHAARKNAQSLGLNPVIEKADAFSDEDLKKLGKRNLVIVSGLHEIIADDQLVQNHFHQINRVLNMDGRLILTIQPDHPQVEFIARVLKSHTGKPWAMRLRSKDLIRRWLNDAGFQILSVEMEEKGIFGVIVAEKVWHGKS